MKFDLGEVLSRAWQITWKNKVLWGISALPFLIMLILFPLMIPMFFLMRNLDAAIDVTALLRLQAIFAVIVFPIIGLVQGFSLTYLKSTMVIVYLRLTRETSAAQPLLQEMPA